MNNYESVAQVYRQRLADFEKQLSVIGKQRSRIGWLRAAIVLLTAVIIIYSWTTQPAAVLGTVALAGIIFFLLVVSKDAAAKSVADNLGRLAAINKGELSMLNGDFTGRETGITYQPAHHSYAGDLDIFGEYSLYQYINRCTTQMGKALLAQRLLQPLAKKAIEEEQEAVKDAAAAIDWRQQFVANGMESQLSNATATRIEEWLQQPAVYEAPVWTWVSRLYPVITLGTTLLYLLDVISAGLFYAAVFVFFLFATFLSRKIHPVWALLSRIGGEVATLQKLAQDVENQPFGNPKYSRVKALLVGSGQRYAAAEVKAFNSILNRFDVRLNVFAFFFLNSFLLWDLHQVRYLNKWKQANQHNVSNWFAAIAEAEVLVSLATLAFNHPHWQFPNISGTHFTLQGTGIGHPLIGAGKRVDNDFDLSGTGKIAIITGSNMGGKSTFLRSVGVNMVLAFMGAPVCARSFTVSVVSLMTSMRITDNLAESTSTFYAELKKLQTIIAEVKKETPIFILLDEILRGTNSLDRHAGSAALIKQLVQCRAVGVIATHDVELANLEKTFPQAIANYHFDVQVNGNDLFFDYRLKHGICQSMNASILMKNIGIELE